MRATTPEETGQPSAPAIDLCMTEGGEVLFLVEAHTRRMGESTYDTAHSRLRGEENPGSRRKQRRVAGSRRQELYTAHCFQRCACGIWMEENTIGGRRGPFVLA